MEHHLAADVWSRAKRPEQYRWLLDSVEIGLAPQAADALPEPIPSGNEVRSVRLRAGRGLLTHALPMTTRRDSLAVPEHQRLRGPLKLYTRLLTRSRISSSTTPMPILGTTQPGSPRGPR